MIPRVFQGLVLYVYSGVNWYIVQPGATLRWIAELQSLSPILTPSIDQIQIWMEEVYINYLPVINR